MLSLLNWLNLLGLLGLLCLLTLAAAPVKLLTRDGLLSCDHCLLLLLLILSWRSNNRGHPLANTIRLGVRSAPL